VSISDGKTSGMVVVVEIVDSSIEDRIVWCDNGIQDGSREYCRL